MMKAIFALLTGMLFVTLAVAQQDTWTPNALFRLENSTPQQTQIFVSGLSYGLTTYSQELEKSGNPKLFCMSGNGMVMSPMIYDILNSKFNGQRVTAKQATLAIVTELRKKFPCK